MSLPEPSYLLAASLFSSNAPIDLSELMAIKPKSASKLHWMDMNNRLKRQSITALAHLHASHIIVVASKLVGNKQERARRKCLETLLPYLETLGVSLLTLESRGQLNDKRDIDLLLTLRRKGAVSTIDLAHNKGSEDKHLWIPDQILGAYSEIALLQNARLQNATQEPWESIARNLTTITTKL